MKVKMRVFMNFKVTRQFPGKAEADLKTFHHHEEAIKFVADKLSEDLRYKVQSTYRIYDDLDILLKEYSLADAQAMSSSNEAESSSGKPGSSQTFNPTPFNTKPQPGGMPHSWVKDEDDKDKK
jgi:hypothetical protein